MKHIFGVAGPLAAAFEGFRERAGQIDMAGAIAAAISRRGSLAVEGGTGIGKTFAYLVPAIEALRAEGLRVMVSTYTRNLQDQLVKKDLPRLHTALGGGFEWAVLKGRGNYLSKRRLQRAFDVEGDLYGERGLNTLTQWVSTSAVGDVGELRGAVDGTLWGKVESHRDHCLAQRCPTHGECFFFNARREAQGAGLLVVNHAVFLSHLAMGKETLPEPDVLIFDEAHRLEDAALEHLGLKLERSDLARLSDRLLGSRQSRGILERCPEALRSIAQEFKEAGDAFFRLAHEFSGHAEAVRLKESGLLPNLLQGPGSSLHSALAALADDEKDVERSLESSAAAHRVREVLFGMDKFLNPQEGWVHWFERSGKQSVLRACPVEPGKLLKESVFSKEGRATILTSATMFSGVADDLEERLGFTGDRLIVPSPFDYEKQMDLVIDVTLANEMNRAPTSGAYSEHDALEGSLRHHLTQALPGGVFVLFTAHASLREMAKRLRPFVEGLGRTLLAQGPDGGATALFEDFLTQPNGVLFGAESFWTGVDVPGEGLTNVIIVKLPFPTPGLPLMEAREELVKSAGGNPFNKLYMPVAALKLRQGVGRLIRTSEDKGRVVILDHRIITKGYGKRLRKVLPHPGRVVGGG